MSYFRRILVLFLWVGRLKSAAKGPWVRAAEMSLAFAAGFSIVVLLRFRGSLCSDEVQKSEIPERKAQKREAKAKAERQNISRACGLSPVGGVRRLSRR